MIEVLQTTIALTLFESPERLVALLDDATVSQYQQILPDKGPLYVTANSASYLDEMQKLLAQEQPTCLFLAPPLIPSERLPRALRKRYPHLGLHEIAVQLALENSPAQCLIGSWLPHGFFVNVSSQSLREHVNATATPRFIVDYEFSLNFIGDEAGIKMYLLVVQTGDTDDRLVRFFRCPEVPMLVAADGQRTFDDARQRAVLKDLRKLIKQGGGTTEFGYVLREGIPANTPWLFDRHHPNYQRRIEDLRHFGDVRPLGELVDMRLGFPPTEQVNLLIPSRESDRGIPVIEGRDINTDNVLHYEDTRYRALLEKAEPYQLQAGDICLRAVIAPDEKLKAVQIQDEMLPLVANNTVLTLRAKPEVNLDRDFLAAYLQSDHVVHALRAQGIAQRLYTQSLSEIPVPVQDEELRAALRDLRTAAQTLSEWRLEANAAIRSLFDFESAKDARAHLLAAGRLVRQRERAARQIDDVSYRLRTGLPHPVAYRWRVAEIAQPDLVGYRDVLKCAEVVTCYLALVALVLMRTVGEPVSYIGQMSERLTRRGHGTNFGDWVAILREVQGRKALRQMANVPFYEVARFLDNQLVDDALTHLKQNRDDDAHDRSPDGPEIPIKAEENLSALRILMEATEFLSEYPLRYVEETYRDSIAGITHYRYRAIMGDHVLVPVLEAETTTAELEAHSLYLLGRTGELHLMRPFLTRRECPTCGRWEIFFLDHYDSRQDRCMLKSMERGHTVEDDAVAAVFRHVRLLA